MPQKNARKGTAKKDKPGGKKRSGSSKAGAAGKRHTKRHT